MDFNLKLEELQSNVEMLNSQLKAVIFIRDTETRRLKLDLISQQFKKINLLKHELDIIINNNGK